MNIRKPTYTVKHKLSSLLMILALGWLTVCLPYVAQSQQCAKTQIENSTDSGDCTNPLSNEEKTESGTSLLAEYLHELPELAHNFLTLSCFNKCHTSDLYLAYHPDLIIPPPEV